jgi:NADPH:quinone reductase-like Zn-dependent oxidoreductase
VPPIGDRQALARVRAVALQRADLDLLAKLRGGSTHGPNRARQIVCSDAAGDVLAVGRCVNGVGPESRVTSLYFKDFVDGTLCAEKQYQGRGYQVDGVLFEHVWAAANSMPRTVFQMP